MTSTPQNISDTFRIWSNDPDESLLEIQLFADVVGIENNVTIPSGFAVYQNHPNPFKGQTTIAFDLPQADQVSLIIYNSIGQKIYSFERQTYPAGHHQVVWSGQDFKGNHVPTGIYFYRLQTGGTVHTRRMILIE